MYGLKTVEVDGEEYELEPAYGEIKDGDLFCDCVKIAGEPTYIPLEKSYDWRRDKEIKKEAVTTLEERNR